MKDPKKGPSEQNRTKKEQEYPDVTPHGYSLPIWCNLFAQNRLLERSNPVKKINVVLLEGIVSHFVTSFHTLLFYKAECEFSKQTGPIINSYIRIKAISLKWRLTQIRSDKNRINADTSVGWNITYRSDLRTYPPLSDINPLLQCQNAISRLIRITPITSGGSI